MGLMDRVANWFGYSRAEKKLSRSYESAKISRLNWGWLAPVSTQDSENKRYLPTLRARSRELCRNNDYARKYIKMVSANIVGSTGIKLQAKVLNDGGSPDTLANQKIEEAWKDWGRRGRCTVDGKLAWVDLQNLAVESVARDGEVLLRKIGNWDGNKFRFALQVLEADYLDDQKDSKNTVLSSGNVIRQGVEFNSWGQPVAYYIRRKHPGDYLQTNLGQEVDRIPASEIIHLFVTERAGQSRGVPWMHTAMRRLDQVGEYEEAEIVAARLGASSCGFFKRNPTSMSQMIPDGKTDSGEMVMDAVPGTFRELPPGIELDQFSVDHPTTQYGDFIKASLRGAAAGLLVSYANLACDLRDVNYSSIRAGLLEERDLWRTMQTWLVNNFNDLVFAEWLRNSLLSQAVQLPFAKYEKFLSVKWQPRGWRWVDPEKDIKASILELQANLNTRRRIIEENYGEDFEDTIFELSEEEKLLEQYGLKKEMQPEEVNNNGNKDKVEASL